MLVRRWNCHAASTDFNRAQSAESKISHLGFSVKERDGEQSGRLVGHTYKWESNRTRWEFNSDGTSTADDSRFPWVALNGNEVLLMMNDGTLRILLFNEDRIQCRVGFLPPTKAGKNTLKLIK
jgi:hypothetical protein